MKTPAQIRAKLDTWKRAEEAYRKILSTHDSWPGPFIPLIKQLEWVLEDEEPCETCKGTGAAPKHGFRDDKSLLVWVPCKACGS